MQATLLSLLTLLIVSMAAAVIFDQIRKLVTAWIRQKDRRRLPYDIPDLFTSSITDDAQAPVASFAHIIQVSPVLDFKLTNCKLFVPFAAPSFYLFLLTINPKP